LISNTSGEETISVKLTPEEIEVLQAKSSNREEKSQRDSPDVVREFLSRVNPAEMTTWSGVGREIHRLGLSSNDSAGRSMSTRWREQGLIKMDSGVVVAGDSLIPSGYLANPYINANAS
jgi:hypothetical protein